MIRVLCLALVMSAQVFADDIIHVTGPGVHHFSVSDSSYDIEYRRTGMPQPGCSDECNVFGCNQGPTSGPFCEATTSIGLPVFSHWVETDVELEILPAPEGMLLDEKFRTSTGLSFTGSKQFAFLRKDVKVSENWSSSNRKHVKLKVSLKPLAIKNVVDSVKLHEHVNLKDGIFTYITLAAPGPVKINARLILTKAGNIARREIKHWLNESDLAPHRTSEMTSAGLKHTVDLNKVLKSSLEKGTWTMSLNTSVDSKTDILVENGFREKLESSLWYSLKVK